MKKSNVLIVFISIFLLSIIAYSKNSNGIYDSDLLSDKIEVVDWKFYVASRVAILYNLTLENKSSHTFEDIKIKVNYYSTYPSAYGKKIGQQAKLLNIKLPPNSRKTFFKEGYPIGAGSQGLIAKNLEIISAKVVEN
ncbi:MAG: hypothetical protein GTO02_18465 [Candidatus Dadabacteria bacterium]|nr:hypothetical protein [Candidatus Dadabacteria bacterium]NIQ16296.1 hypothetical protein [Candidatus Dadabacteria bacterium]